MGVSYLTKTEIPYCTSQYALGANIKRTCGGIGFSIFINIAHQLFQCIFYFFKGTVSYIRGLVRLVGVGGLGVAMGRGR